MSNGSCHFWYHNFTVINVEILVILSNDQTTHLIELMFDLLADSCRKTHAIVIKRDLFYCIELSA